MCCKSKKFIDHIVGCEDIRVNAVFAANTSYVWEIIDEFNNIYQLPFETDGSGIGIIDVSQLPEGFCNPYLNGFTLRLKSSIESCEYIDIPFIQNYETVEVNINAGNVPKSFIGCPYEAPNNVGFISGKKMFIGQEDQTTYQNNDIKNAVQLLVFNESGILQEGDEYNQYEYNETTGTVSFGQSVAGQSITIIYFK